MKLFKIISSSIFVMLLMLGCGSSDSGSDSGSGLGGGETLGGKDSNLKFNIKDASSLQAVEKLLNL